VVSGYAASISLSSFLVMGVLFRYKIQTVAIKVVHKGETPEEIAKREARFAREVAMLSRVQHKNLVKV
jgi:serine/threonine protein kinase